MATVQIIVTVVTTRYPSFEGRPSSAGRLRSGRSRLKATSAAVASVAIDPANAVLGEEVADLVEPRLEALTLDRGEIGRGEGELELLNREHQVAGRDVVLAHVEVRIARVASSARCQSGELDLVRRR